MAGKGVYLTEQSPAEPVLTEQSPAEPVDGASWPTPEFRAQMLWANYGKAWADPDRAKLLDAVLVCFVDVDEVKDVDHRPGAYVLLEKHIENPKILVVLSLIHISEPTRPY